MTTPTKNTATAKLRDTLASYYGTEAYHVNPLYRWMRYTDGVKAFAMHAGNGAYWLLDIIGTECQTLARNEGFVNIVLSVGEDKHAVITFDDGDDQEVMAKKSITYTDCPPGTWRFFLVSSVLMLPSEY
jgi:hypothetical protein